MTTLFHDICTNPARYDQQDSRKFTVTVDGHLIGIVLATKNYAFDTFALNKGEFDDLLDAKRDGRVAGIYVVGRTTYNGGKYDPKYVGEIDGEKLEKQLIGVDPRPGRFGPFYVLNDFTFGERVF
jgi:hypothetical protein